MTRIKLILSGVIAVTFAGLGAAAAEFPGFMMGLFLAVVVDWTMFCMVFVPDQTVAQVYHRIRRVTVRLLEPGLHWILFPIETIRPPISTCINIDSGVTLGGRSADGVPFAFKWSIWYQLAPHRIPLDRLAATIDLLLKNTHGVLDNLVGIALRQLITQKPAVTMAKDEGYQILDRFFRPTLRREAETEGFIIHRALIEVLEVPQEMQSILNQAAGIDAEVGTVAQAGQTYDRMGHCYTESELAFMERMELIRAMRKGGSVVNVVSSNHS